MSYKTAFHLYKNYGMRPKTKEIYELHTVGGVGFDYELLFTSLEQEREQVERHEFFEKYRK